MAATTGLGDFSIRSNICCPSWESFVTSSAVLQAWIILKRKENGFCKSNIFRGQDTLRDISWRCLQEVITKQCGRSVYAQWQQSICWQKMIGDNQNLLKSVWVGQSITKTCDSPQNHYQLISSFLGARIKILKRLYKKNEVHFFFFT